MKNKILLGILLTHTAVAGDTITIPWDPKPLDPTKTRGQEIEEWNKLHPGTTGPLTQQEKEYFRSQGLPVPGDPVSIKSINSIKMNDEAKTSALNYVKEQKEKGYADKFSTNAKNLSEMPEIAQKEFETYTVGSLNAESTHLRRQSSELRFNFNYKPLASEITQEVIGFAPESNYVESGWNGAVEFFKWHEHNSVCAFHEVNIKRTGSSAFFPKEIVRNDINKKLTLVSAEGNPQSLYLYTVEWWDNTYKRILECTASEYSDDITNEVIGMAKSIDESR